MRHVLLSPFILGAALAATLTAAAAAIRIFVMRNLISQLLLARLL